MLQKCERKLHLEIGDQVRHVIVRIMIYVSSKYHVCGVQTFKILAYAVK